MTNRNWIERFGLLAIALGMTTACAQSGQGDSPGSQDDNERLAGFVRYSALGSGCTAAVAVSPAEHYGPLSFIPCPTGEAGCGELAWDGPVRWDPIGTGDMLKFSVQVGLDATGASSRLLVTHQYPTGNTSGLPYEAVAYDVKSGAPIAAWRNLGDQDDQTPGRASIGGSDCLVNVGIGESSAVVVAKHSNAATIGFAVANLEHPSEARTFTTIDVDESVMDRPLFAGGSTAAFERADGRLYRVDLATGANVASYGPNVRVWLAGVAATDVLTRSANPGSDGYYWFDGENSFRRVPLSAPVALADPLRLVWIAPTAKGLGIYVAPHDAPEPATAGALLTELPASEIPIKATLGDSTLAIQVETSGSAISEDTDIYLVNLLSGAVRSRKGIPSGSMRLLANGADYVLVGADTYITNDSETQFKSLRRLALSNAP
jgi:hypothetical protein